MEKFFIEKAFYQLKLIFFPCRDNKYHPRFLRSKFLFYYAIILLVLKLAIMPFFLYLPETSFFAALTKIKLIELTNASREELGLQPLIENSTLNEAAHLKAKDMIERGYFAHYSPEGISPWFWLKEIGYDYRAAGENLAVGFLDSEQVHYSWLNSPSHRENILNPNYREIGIAVIKDNFQGKETTLVVQYFGSKKDVIPDITLDEDFLPPGVITKEQLPEDPIITEDQAAEQEEKEGEKIQTEFSAVAGTGEVISAATGETFQKTPAFFLFNFMTSEYYGLIQKIIYGSLAFIIFSLFLTFFCDLFIYHKFKINHKGVILKTISFSVLWSILIFLDKMIIIQLVASNFRIN